MNNYIDFINGNIISKNNIHEILNKNNINCKILNIEYSFYKKIYIKIEEKNQINYLKLCMDKYSISLSKNELDGYQTLNKVYKRKFDLVDYKIIELNNEYSLAKMKFIKGVKGNYFKFKNFYNYELLENVKYFSLKTYVEKIKKKYSFDQSFDFKNRLFNENIDLFVSKFKDFQIPTVASHGDFIHYNTICTINKNYVIDLEFFDKERSFFFDYFHWYFTPIFTKTSNYNNMINFMTKLYPLIFRILEYKKKNYTLNNKEIFINKITYKILFILFVLERIMILKEILELKNLNALVDVKRKNQIDKFVNIKSNLINKLIRNI
jgi:hypothetical protein